MTQETPEETMNCFNFLKLKERPHLKNFMLTCISCSTSIIQLGNTEFKSLTSDINVS